MVTMGLDQVAGGIEVSVAEWSDAGSRTALFDGVLRTSTTEAVAKMVLTFASLFEVRRALVDPSPDEALATLIVGYDPSVFALQRGGEHNAASLAEVAWRRTQTEVGLAQIRDDLNVPHVVSVEPDFLDPTQVVARVYLPPEHAAEVTHLLLALDGAEVLQRSDGARVIEKALPLSTVGLITSEKVAAQVAWPKQVWSLAPTTTLPLQGWSLSLSIYANNALVHEQVVTENQPLGLMNLVDELAREAAEWVEHAQALVEPLRAEWAVYAGPTNVHVEDSGDFMSEQAFLGVIHDKGALVHDYVEENAGSLMAQYPSASLPAEDPFTLPDISLDSYDYEH